jgi:hypothetical protein
LASESDSFWKLSSRTSHQCLWISEKLPVDIYSKRPTDRCASILTVFVISTQLTWLQGPPSFLHVPSSPSHPTARIKILWLACIF